MTFKDRIREEGVVGREKEMEAVGRIPGLFVLGNSVEKLDGAPLSFRNYHSIVEMANSRVWILVNAVGPRAPQGFAKVSAERFSVNSRQVEIGWEGAIVCTIVGRARNGENGEEAAG